MRKRRSWLSHSLAGALGFGLAVLPLTVSTIPGSFGMHLLSAYAKSGNNGNGGGNGNGNGNGGSGNGNGNGNGSNGNGNGNNGNGNGNGSNSNSNSGTSGSGAGSNAGGSSSSSSSGTAGSNSGSSNQGRSSVTSSVSSDGSIDIQHPDGFTETVSQGSYIMKDPQGRTIVNRRAKPDDIRRLRSLGR